MNNIQHISDELMCSTCGACAAVCPRDAISYEITTAGRIYASVNKECIDCGLCSKVCPSEHKGEQQMQGKYNKGHVEAVVVSRSTNRTYYDNAQSGGVCVLQWWTIFLPQERLMQP